MKLNSERILRKKLKFDTLLSKKNNLISQEVIEELNESKQDFETAQFYRDVKHLVLPLGVALMGFASLTGVLENNPILAGMGALSAILIGTVSIKETNIYKTEKNFDKSTSLNFIVSIQKMRYEEKLDEAIEMLEN